MYTEELVNAQIQLAKKALAGTLPKPLAVSYPSNDFDILIELRGNYSEKVANFIEEMGLGLTTNLLPNSLEVYKLSVNK